MTLHHAIPLSNKGQILYADEHSCILRHKKARLLDYLSLDLLVFPSTVITDLHFGCSDGKEPMQYSMDALARDALFALASQEKLPYKLSNIIWILWHLKHNNHTRQNKIMKCQFSSFMCFCNKEDEFNYLLMLGMFKCMTDTTYVTEIINLHRMLT